MSASMGEIVRAAIEDEREACARAICDRCREGHAVSPDAWGEWGHGCERIEDTDIPPEPCPAGAIWGRGGRRILEL